MARLNDTEALVKAGINPPGAVVAPLNGGSGIGEGRDLGADNIRTRNSSLFHRETGVGPESGACVELNKE